MLAWIRRVFGEPSAGRGAASALPNELSKSGMMSGRRVSGQPQGQTPERASLLATNARDPFQDIVDGLNASAAYFDFREAEIYNASLHSVRARREFRDEYLRRIAVLLAYVEDVDGLAAIDREVRAAATILRRQDASEPESLAAAARRIDAEGFDLLRLSDPVSFDALKAAYRQAVKRYHPDVGGDTAIMQGVNAAYGTFHTLVQSKASVEGGSEGSYFGDPFGDQTAGQVMRGARVDQFLALLDDLAVDQAYRVCKEIRIGDLASPAGWRVAELCRLSTLLAACGCRDDAHEVLGRAAALNDLASARGLRFGGLVTRAAETVANPSRLRLILNHRRQAENALRLGLVDRVRYVAAVERIDRQSALTFDERESFVAAMGARRYVQLPGDPTEQGERATGLIPEPDYYSRVDTLTKAQLNEYWRAFFGGEEALVPKYAFIRATALLQAVIKGFDLGTAIEEARAFATASKSGSSLRFYTDGLSKALEFFMSEPSELRRERFHAMQSLDADPRAGISITISLDDEAGLQSSSPWVQKKPILMTPAYLEFVQLPIAAIRRYLQTGGPRLRRPMQHGLRRIDKRLSLLSHLSIRKPGRPSSRGRLTRRSLWLLSCSRRCIIVSINPARNGSKSAIGRTGFPSIWSSSSAMKRR
jgi:hypothetical protein